MIWYCDSSAVVKRYVRETGSAWFRREHGQHSLLTSALTVAEVPAALARRMRDGSISTFEFHRGRTQYTRHLRGGQYAIVPATSDVIQLSAILTTSFRLLLMMPSISQLLFAICRLPESISNSFVL